LETRDNFTPVCHFLTVEGLCDFLQSMYKLGCKYTNRIWMCF